MRQHRVNNIPEYINHSFLNRRHCFELLRQTNHPTRYSRPRIASFSWLGMVCFAQIVLLSMQHDRSSHDRVLPIKRNQLIRKTHIGVTEGISIQVAQIANMSLIWKRSSMFQVMRIVVGASCGTSLGEISELMDMYSMFSIWIESLDWEGDLGGRVDAVLTEGGYSSNIRFVGVEYADGMSLGIGGDIIIEEECGGEGGSESEGKDFSKHYYKYCIKWESNAKLHHI